MVLLHSHSKDILASLLAEPVILPCLSRLRDHHRESYQHSLRVGLLSLDVGIDFNLEEAELKVLGRAGVLHDIGKVRIPVRILEKDGPLDLEEKAIMKDHPKLGFIELDGFPDRIVKSIVVSHHEFKADPYPRSGADQRTNRPATEDRRNAARATTTMKQIVAVSDIFDALASRRSYKPALRSDALEAPL